VTKPEHCQTVAPRPPTFLEKGELVTSTTPRPRSDREARDNVTISGTFGSGVVSGDLAAFATPENIAIIVSLTSAAIGITTATIKGLALWIDERKCRKIQIRYQDLEVEISGSLSDFEIERRLNAFCRIRERICDSDVQLIVCDDSSSKK
jgi:hypothetical protein